MIKSYKVRLYPNKEQEKLFWRHIGASRFVWNYLLGLQKSRFEEGEKHLSGYDMQKVITGLKKDPDYTWLKSVNSMTLNIVALDLADAYSSFFKKQRGYPKFKSRKRDRPSFPVASGQPNSFYFKDEKKCHIAKIGKVRYRAGKKIEFPIGKGNKYSNVRISFNEARRIWMLSFGVEFEFEMPELTDNLMGIDLGVKELAVVANGEESVYYSNINKSQKVRRLKKEIKRVQKNLSRKYDMSMKRNGGKYVRTKNIEREEQKLRRLYGHLAGIRQNYTHQTTHELVSKFPKRIVMENLDIKQMMSDKHMAEQVAEQSMYEFRRQMEYKSKWRGIEMVFADRYFPSSKTCSRCGAIKKDLKLSDRTYVCTECGLEIDRDYNAALNLQKYMVDSTNLT